MEKIKDEQNQREIIAIMDKFADASVDATKKSVRGILSTDADASLIAKEKGAWENDSIKTNDIS